MYPLTFDVLEWLELNYEDRNAVDDWLRTAGCIYPERVKRFTHVPFQVITHLYLFDDKKLLWDSKNKEFATQLRSYTPKDDFPLSDSVVRNAKQAYQQRLQRSNGKT